MSALEHIWPDKDRRDDALERVAAVVKHSDDIFAARHGAILSDAETRVLHAASVGLSPDETAEVFGRSIYTIRQQLGSARRRLAAKSTVHAVAIALREGLIQ